MEPDSIEPPGPGRGSVAPRPWPHGPCCITMALQKPELPAVTAAPYLWHVTCPQKQALLFWLVDNQPLKNRRWLQEGAWGESVLEGTHPWARENKIRCSPALAQNRFGHCTEQSCSTTRSIPWEQRCFAACTLCRPCPARCSRGWDLSALSGHIQAPSSPSWSGRCGWRWRGLGSS